MDRQNLMAQLGLGEAAFRELLENARAWPWEEARRLEKKLGGKLPEKGYVLFETGYGPSGLPHIGTFGEVARTSMVRHAFAMLTGMPTKLIAFSDDMDALRKVPGNVPNQERLQEALGLPLTKVPDPFDMYDSFGAHNNAMLQKFLDQFGFDYEFRSATQMYCSGAFDDALLRVLACYDEVMAVMLPTLGAERQKTYAPFLPISPSTGRVLQVPVLDRDVRAGTITFVDEDGTEITQSVTGGKCKLQWKPDWAMRWHALDVNYEMAGKDLIPSIEIGQKLVAILGKARPLNYNYELFLDQNGEKISKSRGNGISIEEWLTYAAPESLSLFMYHAPRKAKRLYFDVIPKTADDYATHLEKWADQDAKNKLENPVWHIHQGEPPRKDQPVGFSMLLNLVSASNSSNPELLWGYISAYAPGVTPTSHPDLDEQVQYAMAYYRDFVAPQKHYRVPNEREHDALRALRASLAELQDDATAEDIQTAIFTVGKDYGFQPLRSWFSTLYETLLGQSEGPRMGSFVKLYGLKSTLSLIDQACARSH